MEDNFSFLIDFQSITDIPMSEVLNEEPSQDIEFVVEIIRNGKRAYQCTAPDCGKIYRFKSEMNRHVIIHQNDRPYRCSFKGCSKTFKRPETLEEHMRIHEGSLPFACDHPECDRRFASKPALRYHRLIHKNNRKFKCNIEGCDKSFLTNYQLKQHLKTAGSHCAKSPSDDLEGSPYKLYKSESDSDISETSSIISENIQWQKKSQMHKDFSPEEKLQEMHDLFQTILAENRVLKDKLYEYENSKSSSSSSPRSEDQSKFQYDNISTEIIDPNSFFESYDTKLFDFLEEKHK